MPSSKTEQQVIPHLPTAEPDDRAPLAISVHHHPNRSALVVDLTGELDVRTAPALQAILEGVLRERCPIVVVDMSAVEFMGSAGLAVLIDAHHRADPHTSLRIVAASRVTLRPLQVTGLDAVLNLYGSCSDALTAPPDSTPAT